MPIYEYQCRACETQHEFLQKMSASAKRKCPACGKLKLKRLPPTGVGFKFNGDGFYVNDYPKKNE